MGRLNEQDREGMQVHMYFHSCAAKMTVICVGSAVAHKGGSFGQMWQEQEATASGFLRPHATPASRSETIPALFKGPHAFQTFFFPMGFLPGGHVK